MNQIFGGRENSLQQKGATNIKSIMVLTLLLALSVFSTINALSGDYTMLIISIGLGFTVIHFSGFWKSYWLLILVLGLTKVYISPFQFSISYDFFVTGICLLMLSVAFIDTVMGRFKNPLSKTPGGILYIYIIAIVFLIYLLLQGFCGWASPVYAADYALKNTVKLYVKDSLPFLVFVIMWPIRGYLPENKNLLSKMGKCMLAAMIVLIAIRSYEFMMDIYNPDNDNSDVNNQTLRIPGINMITSVYALRSASVIVAVYGVILCLYSRNKIGKNLTILGVVLIGFALVGSLMSGGRGVIILSIAGMMMATWFYGRKFYLVAGIGLAVLIVMLVNVAGPVIDSLPYYARRSVALLRFDDNDEKHSIAGSSDMREWVYQEGMREWRSDPRIMITGRGTLEYTSVDVGYAMNGNEDRKWESALRTGRLHKTIGSLLIRYGIIGALLYFLFFSGWIIILYKKYKEYRFSSNSQESLALLVCVLVISCISMANMLIQEYSIQAMIVFLGIMAMSNKDKAIQSA